MTKPDSDTEEVMQCKCILLEPRSLEHLENGLHFQWLNEVLQVSSSSKPGGIILILVRETAHNKKLIAKVEELVQNQKKVIYILLHLINL